MSFDIGSLFDDTSDACIDEGSVGNTVSYLKDVPPLPRSANSLCGIYNQGATCYLNALLQTLYFTTEFREKLLSIPKVELGRLEDKDKRGAKVRIIPIYLQRLFAEMYLVDQQAVSTADLTDSFGWKDNEQLQQHDVQELNRILFHAIEESLVATSGASIIQDLYKGIVINEITCTHCKCRSERKEEFLDLCVSVSGNKDLHSALTSQFIDFEEMGGDNKYRCDACKHSVNALKRSRLKVLPRILTISLLRFNFDLKKMERYKETGKFEFPQEIDLADYVMEEAVGSYEYELFSIVIHGGSTYGGHYHAYIQDTDRLGVWTDPDEGTLSIPIDPSTGIIDYVQIESPQHLCRVILHDAPDKTLTLNQLSSEIVKRTGVSWNKHYKRQWGPLPKFFQRYDEYFSYDDRYGVVSLTTSYSVTDTANNNNTHTTAAAGRQHTDTSSSGARSKPSKPRRFNVETSGHWFNFNDSHVYAIKAKDIEAQYSGKESAYMLFYRLKTSQCHVPREPQLSAELDDYIRQKNEELATSRLLHEEKMNSITVDVHLGVFHSYHDGALHPDTDSLSHIEITTDKRYTVLEFMDQIIKETGNELPADLVLHTAKQYPAGLHLMRHITGNSTLKQNDIETGTKIFAWNGDEVKGKTIPCGLACRPILLNLTRGGRVIYSGGFAANITVLQLFMLLTDVLGEKFYALDLYRVQTEKYLSYKDTVTLNELNLQDDEEISLDRHSLTNGPSRCQSSTQMLDIYIENTLEQTSKCLSNREKYEVEMDSTIEELKARCLSLSSSNIVDRQCCLRLLTNHDPGPPLYEDCTIAELDIKPDSILILEPGESPRKSQLFLTVKTMEGYSTCSFIIDAHDTVENCLNCALRQLKLNDSDWHLNQSNWCGDLDFKLDDASQPLHEVPVRNGDTLLLAKGRLPPKGWVYLLPYLFPYKTLDQTYPANFEDLASHGSGCIELSPSTVAKSYKLDKLKQILMEDPVLGNVVPHIDYLRVRVMKNGRPGRVLRGGASTLQHLKLVNDTKLAVQLLPNEEYLSDSQLLLHVCVRDVAASAYMPSQDVVWDFSQGANPHTLYNCIAKAIGFLPSEITVAKHFPDRYSWMAIYNVPKSSTNNKKKKNPTQNLKKTPYLLADSDTIGVKVSSHDPKNKDDFLTYEDRLGLQKLQDEQEEKRKLREWKHKHASDDVVMTKARPAETAIKISVGDFR